MECYIRSEKSTSDTGNVTGHWTNGHRKSLVFFQNIEKSYGIFPFWKKVRVLFPIYMEKVKK